ncbi:MAG: SBBP repeat-containing protein [Deltaproteobacteria bacterium]|nr:SBBP repeat-containing protein [Deltaproteobacteria bacterium]
MSLTWQKIILLAAALLIGHGGPVCGAERPATYWTSGGHVLGFYPERLVMAARDHAVTIDFAGARPVTPTLEKASPLEASQPDPKVLYSSLWRNIDLVYERAAQGVIKSTYMVNPGGDPASIRLRYNQPVHVNHRGELVVRYENGEFREAPPVAWEEAKGVAKSVTVSYRQLSDREIGFSVSGWKGANRLVIDPVGTWNTFLGTSHTDFANGIVVGENGNVYITGTSEYDWGGHVVNPFPGSDNKNAFVAKLDGTSGTQIWNTFLGSGGENEEDYGNGIALDGSGNIYITGTSFHNWGMNPTRGFSGPNGEGMDAFVAKLSAETGELLKHTFLGSTNGQDFGKKIAVRNGKVFVVGTGDGSWQNAPEPKQSYGGFNDAFVARLNAQDLSLDWYTFLGAYGEGNWDEGEDLAVADSGNTYVVGTSKNTWGGAKVVRPHSVGTDAFLSKLDAGGVLVWNTFLGSGSQYSGRGIAVDGSEEYCYVIGDGHGGWTEDPVHPYSYNGDVFVAKLAALGGDLQWHTFLGSGDEVDGYDYGTALALDGNGEILVTGYSLADWGDPIRPFTSGTTDAFAAKLKNTGERLWNTFLGGAGNDLGQSIAVDVNKTVYITGKSTANWLWGSLPPIESYHGQGLDDTFVIKLAYRTISGKVTIGGYPQSGVTVTITDGTAAATDSNGNYQFVVEDGWDGTITPNLGDYVFNPPFKTYQDIFRDEVQDFSAAIIMLAIEGRIIDDELGTPASGVEVTASNGISTVTDNEGKYRIYQPTNWSGTITPSKAGYENGFTPQNRTYSNLQLNTYTEHYNATWKVYISGQVKTRADNPFNNVVVLDGMPRHPITDQPQNTDASGAYRSRVRSGWNGTVTPVYDHTLFTEDLAGTGARSRTYTSVTSELAGHDYWGDKAWYIRGQIWEGTTDVPEVILTASNNGGSTASINGSYTLAVKEGWSGRVTPGKPGYIFVNPYTDYTNVINDLEGQDYQAEWQVNVSGYVKTKTGQGLPNVLMSGLPGNPLTRSDPGFEGYYMAKVSNNWSGKVTPILTGYILGPPDSSTYDNLNQPATQDYTAYPAVQVSGLVREGDGTAVPGVTLIVTTSDPPFTTTTDGTGRYQFMVKKGETPVTVEPFQNGYTFNLPTHNYTSVENNLDNEHFTALWMIYLNGKIEKSSGGGLGGVRLTGLPGNPQTDASGNYRVRLSYDWSGTVAPALLGYRFEPNSSSYSLVDTELTGQNYTAISVPIHTISGRIKGNGSALAGVTLNASSSETTVTDGSGNFQLAFNEGWSGTVTPIANGYAFSPSSRTYTNLVSDFVAQDFISGSIVYLPLIVKP